MIKIVCTAEEREGIELSCRVGLCDFCALDLCCKEWNVSEGVEFEVVGESDG